MPLHAHAAVVLDAALEHVASVLARGVDGRERDEAVGEAPAHLADGLVDPQDRIVVESGAVPLEHDGLVDAVHVHVLHDAAAVGVVGEPGVLLDDLVEVGYRVHVRVHIHVLDESADEGDENAEQELGLPMLVDIDDHAALLSPKAAK